MHLLPLQRTAADNTAPIEEWTAQRLQQLVMSCADGQVIVVSCREPYSHEHGLSGVHVTTPASGLVTALEPVVRACAGTWIAHGSGSADSEFVDSAGLCRVPPGRPEYSLQRVWLDDEERRGFLDGFANESLWPMCHRCDVKPLFRASDWRHYRRVNERFAEAVVQAARQPDPLVLVQDYHFALLPELIRAYLPRATVVAFWHIPWPEPDRLELCPWWHELVRGLMRSSIVGFQTARDQENFQAAVEVCERHSKPSASWPQARTFPLVATYPISVPWPAEYELDRLPSVADCRSQVLREHGLMPSVRLIVGVDRFDYTKGLLEKLRALELLLDRHPRYPGSVSLVQVVAPTRAGVPAYAAYQSQVRAEAARINMRFRSDGALPIILLESQHDREAVDRLYRAACVCAVTSLDDGMNLVSKEFVSMRDDEQGVLVLSAFAGAAEELQHDAIVVNPRDTSALSHSLETALAMGSAQQRHHMARMRVIVRKANIYQWAGAMLSDAAQLRQDSRQASAPWREVA